MLKVGRKKIELVNYLTTSAIVKCDKADNSIQSPKVAKEEKKKDAKQKRSLTENLYRSHLKEEDKAKAQEKLKSLIRDMQNTAEDNSTIRDSLALDKRKTFGKFSQTNKASFDEALAESAKRVANELRGDSNKTVSDLINSFKLLENSRGEHDFSKSHFQPSDLKKASAKVANILGKLTKIDHTKQKTIEFIEGLDIFRKRLDHKTEKINLKIWDELEKEEIKFIATNPPRNHFEELVLWTEQNKLWHFPVDNDQGMNEEARTDFTEHVFLEKHLEPWCPEKGPIRHFMELVLVGLSKNPYLSVKDKKEHIFWFKDYFYSKKELLTEVGAFTSNKIDESQKKT